MLYPRSSAYRSETGGLMAMLRVLTAEQSEPYIKENNPTLIQHSVREYHAKYYVPQNVYYLPKDCANDSFVSSAFL